MSLGAAVRLWSLSLGVGVGRYVAAWSLSRRQKRMKAKLIYAVNNPEWIGAASVLKQVEIVES